MNVTKVSYLNFKESTQSKQTPKREIIDVITDAVKNPRDVNDCVAVPRGIFKAYMLIMAGSAVLALSNLIPSKNKFGKCMKTTAVIFGWLLNTLSAVYYAKPFAVKGLSPTIKKEDLVTISQETK